MLPYVGYSDAPRESQEVVVPVPRVSVGQISPWVNKACSAHRFRSQAMPRTRPYFISQCTQPGPHLTPHTEWVGALFVGIKQDAIWVWYTQTTDLEGLLELSRINQTSISLLFLWVERNVYLQGTFPSLNILIQDSFPGVDVLMGCPHRQHLGSP